MARIVGVDAARGLALAAMIVAHTAPPTTSAVLSLVDLVSRDRSRLLFALAAGLGLGLVMSRYDLSAARDRAVLRGRLAIRAACLFLLGAGLQLTGVPVFVILDEYGLAFAVMLPLLCLGRARLLWAGAALLGLAPALVYLVGLSLRGGQRQRGAWSWLADVLVRGAYPVPIWVAILMIGVALTQYGLRRRAVIAGLALAGTGLAAVGHGLNWLLGGSFAQAPTTRGALANAVAASGFTVGNVGLALVVTAGLIAVTTARTAWEPARPGTGAVRSGLAPPDPAPPDPALPGRGWPSRLARGLLAPLSAAGAMPLSLYTAHLLVLLVTLGSGPERTFGSWWATAGMVALTCLVGWCWRRWVGRGPLEAAISWLAQRVG
jgi:hypothetical protein